jgi:hypothetical protein
MRRAAKSHYKWANVLSIYHTILYLNRYVRTSFIHLKLSTAFYLKFLFLPLKMLVNIFYLFGGMLTKILYGKNIYALLVTYTCIIYWIFHLVVSRVTHTLISTCGSIMFVNSINSYKVNIKRAHFYKDAKYDVMLCYFLSFYE